MRKHLEKISTDMNFLVFKPTKNIDELNLNSPEVTRVAREFTWAGKYGHFRKPMKVNNNEYYHGFAIRGSILLGMGFTHAVYEHNNTIVHNHYYIRYKNTFIPVYLKGWSTSEKEVHTERVHY